MVEQLFIKKSCLYYVDALVLFEGYDYYIVKLPVGGKAVSVDNNALLDRADDDVALEL